MNMLCIILATRTYGASLLRARSTNRPTQRGRSRGNSLVSFSGRLPSGLGTRVPTGQDRSGNEYHQSKEFHHLASQGIRVTQGLPCVSWACCRLTTHRRFFPFVDTQGHTPDTASLFAIVIACFQQSRGPVATESKVMALP